MRYKIDVSPIKIFSKVWVCVSCISQIHLLDKNTIFQNLRTYRIIQKNGIKPMLYMEDKRFENVDVTNLYLS